MIIRAAALIPAAFRHARLVGYVMARAATALGAEALLHQGGGLFAGEGAGTVVSEKCRHGGLQNDEAGSFPSIISV